MRRLQAGPTPDVITLLYAALTAACKGPIGSVSSTKKRRPRVCPAAQVEAVAPEGQAEEQTASKLRLFAALVRRSFLVASTLNDRPISVAATLRQFAKVGREFLDHVDQAAEHRFADRRFDRIAGRNDLLSAPQSDGRAQRNRAYAGLADMRLHLRESCTAGDRARSAPLH